MIATPHGLDFDALQLRLHPAASRVAKLAAETPASFVAFDLLAVDGEDLRERAAARAARAARALLAGVHAAGPPDADDARPRRGRRLARAVRGRRPRRRDRQAARRRLPAGQARDDQDQARRAPPTASSPASAGTRAGQGRWSARCCSASTTTTGTLHHVGVTSSFTMARAARARGGARAAARRTRSTDHPWRDWAERASATRADAHAGRPEPLERRQGPLVGAAADRARVRGEVRPPAGRSLPPRGGVPALAPRQAARRLPLRSARGHDRLTSSQKVFGAAAASAG